MAAPLRKNSSMMAMLDAKPEAKGENVQEDGQDGHDGQNGQTGQDWSDESDHLSPLRKHLISTYLQVTDEEALPLLGEYFGVALSFVALGALVRASNTSKRKHMTMMSEEEKLDIRSCSRFERMALESMLKESMERLGNLSMNAFELEARVRNLVEENKEVMEARDKEKAQLLKRAADAEKLAQDLRELRKSEGRANERVMSIVAAKEQDWLKEKRNLQKEVEKLKETVNSMTREAKFQARRCRNSTCEHCKGIDRGVRSVKGRLSLRELHSLRESSQAPVKREVLLLKESSEAEPSVIERQEIEEDRVLMKAIELKKKQKEVERLQSGGESSSSGAKDQSMPKELLIKQQHDMESELANILKRVGMLKQKSFLSPPNGPSTSKEGITATEERPPSVDNSELLQQPEDGIALDQNVSEDSPEKASVLPEPNMRYSSDELAYSASEQEESDLVELEMAFDLRVEEYIALQSETAAEDVDTKATELERLAVDADGSKDASTSNEEQQGDVDDELVFLQERVSLEDEPILPEREREHKSNEALEEDTGNLAADISPPVASDDLNEDEETSSSAPTVEEADAQERELTQFTGNLAADISPPAASADLNEDGESSSSALTLQEADAQERELTQDTENLPADIPPPAASADLNGDGETSSSAPSLQESDAEERELTQEATTSSLDGIGPDAEGVHIAESPESSSSEKSINDDEMMLGISDEEDTVEFADALCLPLDPVPCAEAEDRDSSAVQPEQDDTEYDSDMDVKENNWGFKDAVASAEEHGLLENQDIPVFERKNSDDDFAGELPEPEEKRVCGLETLDSKELSTTENETSQQEGESLKDKDNATVEDVGGQKEEEPFVEKISSVADVKPSSDTGVALSPDLEQADLIT